MSAGLAVLAGAGGGVGAAVARRFAMGGYTVALLARSGDYLKQLAHEIEKEGGKAIAIPCDITKEDSVNHAISSLPSNQALSVAIFNVANWVKKPFLELTLQDLQSQLNTNTVGAFLFSKAVLPRMLEQKRGTIIFSGATAGIRGGPQFAAFAASKFGARAIAQSIAREHGSDGIHSAIVTLDGIIEGPRAKSSGWELEEGSAITPNGVAETYWFLHNQPKDAWTHELDLRPFKKSL